MRFIQFKFPNGRRVEEAIERSPEIEQQACDLWDAGWSFEIECNPDTQIVHMDCCDEDRVLANRVCRNGPQVPVKVDELVEEAHTVWLTENKPKAIRA
jgi:hypothetical protein